MKPLALLPALLLLGAAPAPRYDTVIANGVVYDGSGQPGYRGWVALKGDRIAAVGRGEAPAAARRVDAGGKAVAPGFINMQSWAPTTLIADPRGMSDLKQGVTLEVFGEGWTMGPQTDAMRAAALRRQEDITFPMPWRSFGEWMQSYEQRGVGLNVASFVGATTIRIHELGEGDVQPSSEQLARMQALVRQAMNEGAMGVGSALIYAPATYAKTPELAALAKASAACGGEYITHMRSEGRNIEGALDELFTIARDSGGPVEIYHFKLSGAESWGKRADVLRRIEAARTAGLDVRATMYVYTAGATGLDASMPTWVQAGGVEKWVERLRDPATRSRVIAEMRGSPSGWENLYMETGRDPAKVLFIGFRNPDLRRYISKTLADVMKERGTSAEDTMVDLVVADGARVDTVYFLMSEENVKAFASLPWVSLGSDEGAPATEGVFLKSSNHPRAFGNVARFLGHYVRDEHIDTLESAVRRISALPAKRLGLRDRGRLAPGMFADVVIFDPTTIIDRSTYAKPQQYAEGVSDVWVNGVPVLKGGEPTGAKPGRFVKGPGAGRCGG
ncbi:MAG: amidohydrolase family protein [Sphingomonadaceae bacterium]|nr:amidohydrolase family protein [Sphingomonadaceae bacterium]